MGSQKKVGSETSVKKEDFSFSKKISNSTYDNIQQYGKVVSESIFKSFDKKVAIAVFIGAVFISLIMTPDKSEVFDIYKEDTIAEKTIRADKEILIEDKESTRQNTEQIKKSVKEIYDFDTTISDSIEAKIKESFALIDEGYKNGISAYYNRYLKSGIFAGSFDKIPASDLSEMKKFMKTEKFAKLETDFVATLGISVSDSDKNLLRKYFYSPAISAISISVIRDILLDGVTLSKDRMLASYSGVMLRKLPQLEDIENPDFDKIVDIDSVKTKLVGIVKARTKSKKWLEKPVLFIAEKMLVPNITFNASDTNALVEKRIKSQDPVYFKIKKGEVIVREGDKVTKLQEAKLIGLALLYRQGNRYGQFIGFFLVSVTLLVLANMIINKFYSELRHDNNLKGLMLLLLFLHLSLVSFTTYYLEKLQIVSSNPEFVSMAAPFIVGPLLISIFFSVDITIVFTIFIATFTSLMYEKFDILTIMTFVGGILAGYSAGSFHNRIQIIKRGLAIGGITGFLVFLFVLTLYEGSLDDAIKGTVLVFVGVGISIAVVSVLIPLAESFFPVVSDIKLIELSNSNHPALRKLLMEAPGTYHHSMMVSYLAENAAKSIDANPLLARAGAMFHDIGKMKKPDYFFENQQGKLNPHDKLIPSMSALVISNHVKEGLELAKQYKLLPQISAMIPEHHGTQIMKYFYNKALQSQDAIKRDIKDDEFRYPGPIPASKESACVALADSIEAIARACKDPTPLKLKKIVTDAINDKFIQNQLDDSKLTFSDIARLTESFSKGLMAIHHSRIQYPEVEKSTDIGLGRLDQLSTTNLKSDSQSINKPKTDSINLASTFKKI